jgi:tungstate transport system substrate-binding protein
VKLPVVSSTKHAVTTAGICCVLLLWLTGCAAPPAEGETTVGTFTSQSPAVRDVILATTTSTQDTGLLDVLVPMFEKQTGYVVKTIAVGTGAAIAMGQRGEADVLLVHDYTKEVPLVNSGDAINRRLVMHNDFIMVGPADDPAGVKSATTAAGAFQKIAAARATFISRGDASGTNNAELRLWTGAGVTPKGQSWYQESGQGMGATLSIAGEKNAYCFTDNATYYATQKSTRLAVVFEGDPVLLNVYHVMQVNPSKSAMINGEGARAFVLFMIAPETQRVIAGYGLEKWGRALFVADYGKTEAE